MKHSITTILVLLAFFGIQAQHSREYSLNFTQTESQGLSKVFDMKSDSDAPFVSISAFVLQEDLEVQLAYRVLLSGGWSEWQSFKPFTEGETKGRSTFEAPAAQADFTAIQFRSEPALDESFTFRLYYPQAKKKSEALKQKKLGGGANCSCPQPPICLRNCWCTTCPKDSTPDYTHTTHLIVHHSAGANTSNDWAAVVSSIWDFHVNTNGWDDIGYNWLIDPDGIIYEGRGDSISGAHFSCMNSGTAGICLLGNFMTTPPADSALQSLIEMITWEACDKNIAPDGSSFHAFSQLLLPNVAGHRHGNPSTEGCPKGTVCPGDSLFDLLPMIRDSAAANACLGDVSVIEFRTSSLKVYPNPVREILEVQPAFANPGSNVTLRVVNSRGALVVSRQLQLNGNEPFQVDVSQLRPGLYLLQLGEGENAIQTKFVKR